MTVTAMLVVAPLDDSNADFDAEIANAIDALEEFDVQYETHPMETTIQADELSEVFAAAQAATEAVDASRTLTTLKIDHFREETLDVSEKVERVERHLGRSARNSDDDAE
ncbi:MULTISPECIES: thiamine-binding protein [unclassified Haladaptatus]|uniref:thiamine-binding protein n=1 Tax=unclassified Haladaptatus TaxID=2622732 RepID=UPI00209C12B2|nr:MULTISPECIES: thiamine-binding protein [unclassified Haladaptatus]MCO8243671.1 thiamine-binding protein [Haladaptatus sp. AB643]MCO8255080.1 thiamine-binding protein [Haladaptatus sp. AB618]